MNYLGYVKNFDAKHWAGRAVTVSPGTMITTYRVTSHEKEFLEKALHNPTVQVQDHMSITETLVKKEAGKLEYPGSVNTVLGKPLKVKVFSIINGYNLPVEMFHEKIGVEKALLYERVGTEYAIENPQLIWESSENPELICSVDLNDVVEFQPDQEISK